MQHRESPARRWWPPVIALVVAAALVALVLTATRDAEDVAAGNGERETGPTGPGAPTAVQGPEEPDLTAVERRDESDLLASGPVDAPVTLVVFSDYQCPFCARWNAETKPLMMELVEDGDLRIEWRDVNVFGPASARAARASVAAARQGAFWEYHDALFANGTTRPEAQLSEESLIDLAGELSLDTGKFATDLGSTETLAEVAANEQLGLDLGAFSTPTFILGGQPIVGAQPSEVFLDAFEVALSRAG